MATADNGELMALSGFINPYPGRLGVVEEGALADLLLVDGDPLDRHRARRGSRQEFSGHHEGRHDLQEYPAQVSMQPPCARCDSRPLTAAAGSA